MWFFKRIAEFWRNLNAPTDPSIWANPPATRRPDIDAEIDRVRVENSSVTAQFGTAPSVEPWPAQWDDRGVSDIAEAIEYRGICEALRDQTEGAALSLLCSNADFVGPSYAVEFVSDVTNWEPSRFTGETMMEALRAAHLKIFGRRWQP